MPEEFFFFQPNTKFAASFSWLVYFIKTENDKDTERRCRLAIEERIGFCVAPGKRCIFTVFAQIRIQVFSFEVLLKRKVYFQNFRLTFIIFLARFSDVSGDDTLIGLAFDDFEESINEKKSVAE